jgi:hypothetical protein
MNHEYPALLSLVRMYFGEDFDLWGNTVPEIIACYKSESESDGWDAISNDINNFRLNNSNNLDSAFEEVCGDYIDPEPWGYTTDSFLKELQKLFLKKE